MVLYSRNDFDCFLKPNLLLYSRITPYCVTSLWCPFPRHSAKATQLLA